MAYLDNSGDIILDAVLTDTGRMRLAQGDGSFKITKFALGDDEINYALYNKNHASGSAYYDLEVLQTPVFEAFTNNTSNLNSKLMSMSRTNVLYMPTLKINKENLAGSTKFQQQFCLMYDRREDVTNFPVTWRDTKFVIAVDEDTQDAFEKTKDNVTTTITFNQRGKVVQGWGGGTDSHRGGLIRIDQGLDTDAISPTIPLDADLYESAYIVELDYRLGRLKPGAALSHTPAAVNFIDDDNIASYYVTDNTFIKVNDGTEAIGKEATGQNDPGLQVVKGPRGSIFLLRLHASAELQNSTYLFEQIGNSETTNGASNTFGFLTSDTRDVVNNKTTYYIDSTIRVVGANTGIRMDIPVRYVKIA
jgi:hypothetical protein